MQPHSEWDDLDFELMDALDVLEREMNDSTGLPRWLTGTGSPDVDFVVDTGVDYGQAALDKWDEQQSEKKKKPHGQFRFLVPQALVEGVPIEGWQARERSLLYAASQLEQQPDLTEGLDIDRKRPPGGYSAADYG